MVCSNNACAASCTDGATNCGGSCVNTLSDPDHCGGCFIACTGGKQCTGGGCGCPSGTTDCSGQCTATSFDRNNCGGCGIKCPTGSACRSGSCTPVVTDAGPPDVNIPDTGRRD
jgi:hypothetical protein